MDNIIYEPNKFSKLGIRIWSEMSKELIQSRELIWRLFYRNLSAKYKQSVLGYLWAFIMPFLAIGSFIFLKKLGVVNIGETVVPYPLFALIGLAVWQLFSTGLTSGCNSLVEAGGMIAKINFPKEALVFSSLTQALFEFLIKFMLIIACFFIFGVIPKWGILIFPFALLPILILTLGLSLILSLLNCILRDIANMLTLLVTFLMFLTPVLYPMDESHSLFFKLNPLTSLVNAPRDLIIYGYIIELPNFIIMTVISVLIFLYSWRIFHLVETKIPERV